MKDYIELEKFIKNICPNNKVRWCSGEPIEDTALEVMPCEFYKGTCTHPKNPKNISQSKSA